MDTISITVRVPALDAAYDFLVPINMSVMNVQKLIIKILSSEYGILDNYTNSMLFDLSDNKALRFECSLAQLDISDGSELLLI